MNDDDNTMNDDDKSSIRRPWWWHAVAWSLLLPIIILRWALSIMAVVGFFGGLIAAAVKIVGADIPWTWEQIAFALLASLVVSAVVELIAAAARGDMSL